MNSKIATYLALFFAVTGAALPEAIKVATDAGAPNWVRYLSLAASILGVLKLAVSSALNVPFAAKRKVISIVPPAMLFLILTGAMGIACTKAQAVNAVQVLTPTVACELNVIFGQPGLTPAQTVVEALKCAGANIDGVMTLVQALLNPAPAVAHPKADLNQLRLIAILAAATDYKGEHP
jgi:hypothetical protein